MQLEIDLDRRTVRVDATTYNTTWADGDKLHGEFKAWVRVEGAVVSWGIARKGEDVGGASELDLTNGAYQWVTKSGYQLSRGVCTKDDLTS